jgi:hypothetical protein
MISVIGQVLDAASNRGKEFCVQLKRIEFQAARVANNPNLEAVSPSSRSIMQKRSIGLMIAIVRFLSSSLLFFSRSLSGLQLLELS